MRALVTGGAGFVGSHLVDELLQRDWDVFVVDSMITGRIENLHPAFAAQPRSQLELLEADICDLDVEYTQADLDIVFHLASPASPHDYLRLPIETMLVNSVGTRVALDIARANDARFILTSTSEVYGDPIQHPQRESYWGNVNPVGPRSVYDEGKRFAEALVSAYAREYQMSVGIARIFNTYGPRMRAHDGRVVSTFIRQALDGEELTIFGTGRQSRSLCYVSDLVDGLVRLSLSADTGPTNLGSSDEIMVRDLAGIVNELVAKRTGKLQTFRYQPAMVDDPTRRRPNLERARALLGWYPTTSLVNGLSHTIDYVMKERADA